MAPDRVDCQFAISGLASAMSNPLKHHLEWARHLVGYMCSTRNFSLLLKWQYIGSKTQQLMHGDFPEEDGEAHCLETYTDSDWAGSADRKTVSSICVFLDGNLIHSFTRKQQSRALSSCEGEFTACTAGLSESLYLKECIESITGKAVEVYAFLDSSSAKQLFMRKGVGRIRHLDTRLLWSQDLFQQGRAHLRTVKTKYNVSDAGTKALSQRRIIFLLYLCNYVDVETDEPVGLDIFLEESTREQKAMAVKNISQISRIFSDVDVPSVAHTQNAKQILRVMIALMCATHAKAAENALSGTDENSTVWWTSLERADGVDMFIGFCIFTNVCMMIFAAWKIFTGVFRFAMHKVQSWHQASEPEDEDMPTGMVRINGIPYVPYHPDELEQRAERASAAENERWRAAQHGGARYHRADEFKKVMFLKRRHAYEELESCYVTRHGKFYHNLDCRWIGNHEAKEVLMSDLDKLDVARCRTCHSSQAGNFGGSGSSGSHDSVKKRR